MKAERSQGENIMTNIVKLCYTKPYHRSKLESGNIGTSESWKTSPRSRHTALAGKPSTLHRLASPDPRRPTPGLN